jgi:hypothetical protein
MRAGRIDRLEAFLKSLGCPTRFSELGINGELIEKYSQETLRIIHDGNGKLPGYPVMTEATSSAFFVRHFEVVHLTRAEPTTQEYSPRRHEGREEG